MTELDQSERGATLVEYAILVALIGVVSIGSLLSAGKNAADKLCSGAGFVHDVPVELTYRADAACCGYTNGGIGGGFVCVD